MKSCEVSITQAPAQHGCTGHASECLSGRPVAWIRLSERFLPAEDGDDMKGQPTMGDVAAFDEEMQHELLGAERPGIRSRMSHDLAAFQNTRIQLGVRAKHGCRASAPIADCSCKVEYPPGSMHLIRSTQATALASGSQHDTWQSRISH